MAEQEYKEEQKQKKIGGIKWKREYIF
jgi:hypothetical protein